MPKQQTRHKNLIEVATESGQFTLLLKALYASGLVNLLQGEEPFTIFAPNDKAFESLPEGLLDQLMQAENIEKLKSILKYHIVPSALLAADVVEHDNIESLAGEKIEVMRQNGDILINESKIIKPNIETINGVIHIINQVLIPENN